MLTFLSEAASPLANNADVMEPCDLEIDLNFTYEQYDMLHRAGLISHEQIRNGRALWSEAQRMTSFMATEQRMEAEIAQQVAHEQNLKTRDDVIVTAEFPAVLDCGLKRVDSKRYGKDFVVNRATPQVRRRVWKVTTSQSADGEVVKATPAGEKEVASSDITKQVHNFQDLLC